MKKIFFYIFIGIVSILLLSYFVVVCYKDIKDIKVETDIKGKEISKNEYIYKEELLLLGYTINEIDIIEKKTNTEDVKKYLLNKKYDNLINYLSSNYFNAQNIERYEEYYKNNNSIEKTIIDVEIGLDKEFYTDIKNTDTNDGILMLVNKYNKLNEDYIGNLVNIEENYGTGMLDKEAYIHFKEMCDEASKEGIILKSVSAYRSYTKQQQLYNNYVARDGITKADTYSARPGHSEHQTGLAIDINTSKTLDHFENTKEYKWLINNSYKYGFILRYPENKTHITGYQYEPWHYRYIGINNAFKLYQNNLTYEEYYVKFVK